jgi:hypothetical protein
MNCQFVYNVINSLISEYMQLGLIDHNQLTFLLRTLRFSTRYPVMLKTHGL